MKACLNLEFLELLNDGEGFIFILATAALLISLAQYIIKKRST